MARSSTTFQPGNKAGRGRPKKGESLVELLDKKLDKEAFIDRIILLAMSESAKDSAPYIKLIAEYLAGKPQQTIVNHNIDVTALSDDELKRLAEGK